MNRQIQALKVRLSDLAAKGFFHLLASLGLVQLVSFSLKVLLGHWLSVADFGRVSLVIETHSLLATLMTLALPTAFIRFGLAEGRLDEYLAGAFRIYLVLSVVVLGGFYGLNALVPWFTDAKAARWLNYTALAAPGLALFNYVINWLSARKQAKERAGLVLAQRVLYALGLGGGAYWAALSGAMWGLLAQSLLFGLLLFTLFGRYLSGPACGLSLSGVLRFSGWDSLGHLAGFAGPFMLLWLAERQLDLAQVSWLSMAFGFTVAAKFLFATLYNVMFPYLMEHRARNAFAAQLSSLFGLGLLLSVLVVAVAWLVVPWIIGWLLPPRFEASVPPFRWLVVAECLIGLSLLLEMALEITGAVRLKAVVLLAGLALLVPAGLWGMIHWGALGAAWAFGLVGALRLMAVALSVRWRLGPPSEESLF